MFYYLDGPGSSIAFNPADESITKIQGQSLGPIICSAQCNPPTDLSSTVTFRCHTGNGYGNNATKNLLLTVNCKCLIIEI